MEVKNSRINNFLNIRKKKIDIEQEARAAITDDNEARVQIVYGSNSGAFSTMFQSGLSNTTYGKTVTTNVIRKIAEEIAMHNMRLVTNKDNTFEHFGYVEDNPIDRSLRRKVNERMTSNDMLYNIAIQLGFYGNCIIVPFDDVKKYEFRIINLENEYVVFYKDAQTNKLMLKITSTDKNADITIEYKTVIHLTLEADNLLYNTLKMEGKDNNILTPILDSQVSGYIEELQNNSKFKGVITMQNQQGMGKKADTVKIAEELTSATSRNKDTDFIILSKGYEFKEISNKGLDSSFYDFDSIKNQIYETMGINENIMNGKYSPQEYESFYSSTINPLINKISKGFENQLLTEQEFYDKYFKFMLIRQDATRSIIGLSTDLYNVIGSGLMTSNEFRLSKNIPPIFGGDTINTTRNFIAIGNDSEKSKVEKIDKVKNNDGGNKNE